MDDAEELLARNIRAVDFRIKNRPTLHLKEGAMEELKEIKLMQRTMLPPLWVPQHQFLAHLQMRLYQKIVTDFMYHKVRGLLMHHKTF